MGRIWPFRIRGECRLSGGALESAVGSTPVRALGAETGRSRWAIRRRLSTSPSAGVPPEAYRTPPFDSLPRRTVAVARQRARRSGCRVSADGCETMASAGP